MLNYLTTEENLKNGYHLSDILTKTCYVYKDQNLYAEFEKGVFDTISSEKDETNVSSTVKRQIIDDLESFATKFSISAIFKSTQKINVKKVVYRSTTLFISALARLCNIQASSCFDIVNELHTKNEISDYAKHKMMYAVALACEIRLKWYTKCKKQCDNIDSVEVLLDLIGKKSIMNYFQIAYALQCDISKRLKLKQGHFYSSPTLLNLSLAHCFKDQRLLKIILDGKTQVMHKKWLYNFDECLKMLEKQTAHSHTFVETLKQILSPKTTEKLWPKFQETGDFLREMDCLEDAIDCYQKALTLIDHDELSLKNNQKLSNKTESRKWQKNKSYMYRKTGAVQILLGKHIEGKINLDRALQIQQRISSDIDSDRDVSLTLKDLGGCLTQMNKLDEAKQYLDRSLQIQQRISSDVDSDRGVSITLQVLGRCLMQMNKLDEAKQYLDRSLQIQQRISSDVDSDRNVSITLQDLGHCLTQNDKLDEAKQYLDRSLQIQLRISSDIDSDRDLSITLHELGHCLMRMNKLDEAKHHLDRSLQIQLRISSDIDSDRDVSITLQELGRCLMRMNKLNEAKQYLDRSLQIQQRISSDIDSDRDVSITLKDLGGCLTQMNKLDEAKHHLD